MEKFTEAASLIITHSFSTIIDKKTAVRLTNTTELPYTINNSTQIAKFLVVTPEQSKLIKPVDTEILNLIPKGDPDLTTYLTKLLKLNKLDLQNITFWFPTPKILETRKIIPQFRHESWRNCVNCNRKKTEPKRCCGITNEISITIWLYRHAVHRNWKTDRRKSSSRVPRHICQSLNGYWDEH